MADPATLYPPIEHYGIIGDLHTVALVGRHGSIDFMAFPRFDSPTVFAALLDHRFGGRFSIKPHLAGSTNRQMYFPETNILITRFLSGDGVAEITDFMPVGVPGAARLHTLVRRVNTVRGEVRFDLECAPRFDYGRATHTVERYEHGVVFRSDHADGLALRLRSTVPLDVRDGDACATFTLAAGDEASFVLERAVPGRPSRADAPDFVLDAAGHTVEFWRTWLARSQYQGRWRETVDRSALALKLLFSDQFGTLVAAPTFGLPEEIGGERNWDYRYTWIRDAAFTLYALMRLGYTAEAGRFMHWIEDRCADLNPDGSLQIMYGIDGRRELTEETLRHFEGYRQSAPVRIGNGAYGQLQLDIYGELLDSVYLYNKYGEPISYSVWENCSRLVDFVCRNWHLPDEGIWEVRGGRREFLYSRLMCWVAVDRGVRLAQKRSFPAPLGDWIRCRDAIWTDIFTNFWDARRQTFVQHKGATAVDAASLLMPMVKFISPRDPRWLSTLQAIEEDLVDDSLVFRYRTEHAAHDGLRGGEGTFNMCSFWYAEVLARAGDVTQGRWFFEKMLGYASHLGLYGEELGPSGEHLGNFPQAFTHLGLISAAYALDRSLQGGAWVD